MLAAEAAKLAGKLGEAVDDYAQGGYGRQFAQAVQDGDTSAALTYFAASFLSIGMTVESGGSSSALRGVAQSAAKGMPLVGGGAKLENLTAQEIARIQNAANRTGTEISVVGSRAKGTPGPLSDWDYVVPEATGSRTIHSLRSSLPEGPRSLGEPRNQDFFRSLVDPTKPFITFTPQ
ncbi:hypothetical protein [Allochromatium vinosum]|uniref:hypothetical protein n=1 Tax=Allochromatium vinosum TaxID=1049 RepID=UPI00167F5FB5|nr:hypothetical protein [Allochromatium vinosum]